MGQSTQVCWDDGLREKMCKNPKDDDWTRKWQMMCIEENISLFVLVGKPKQPKHKV